MSTLTPNYEFIIPEGSDLVNPLAQYNPIFTSIDTILRAIANTGITVATELKTGTVHALTRSDTNVPVFRFEATSDFTTGETFTVDGAQVTALTVDGSTLPNGAYEIGSMVLCELRDTRLTVYTSGGTDAQTLNGHPDTYFATQAGLTVVNDKADANKILIDGNTDAITALNTQMADSGSVITVNSTGSITTPSLSNLASKYRYVTATLCQTVSTTNILYRESSTMAASAFVLADNVIRQIRVSRNSGSTEYYIGVRRLSDTSITCESGAGAVENGYFLQLRFHN